MCTLRVNDVNYHKFSHGAVSYAHNEKNVSVMLEWLTFLRTVFILFINYIIIVKYVLQILRNNII